MEHSIIIILFKKIFRITKEFYKFSFTGKIINKISNVLRIFFVNSFIYRIFTFENHSIKKFLEASIMKRCEGILRKIIRLLNVLYSKGIQGSFLVKKIDEIESLKKETKINTISFIIIGAVIFYNLLSVINRSVYIGQIYMSGIVIFLTINFYFIVKRDFYKDSLVKKIIDDILNI